MHFGRVGQKSHPCIFLPFAYPQVRANTKHCKNILETASALQWKGQRQKSRLFCASCALFDQPILVLLCEAIGVSDHLSLSLCLCISVSLSLSLSLPHILLSLPQKRWKFSTYPSMVLFCHLFFCLSVFYHPSWLVILEITTIWNSVSVFIEHHRPITTTPNSFQE